MKFSGTLTEAGGPGGRWVECPFDARNAFGQARPPVVGTVNGVPFRSRLAAYGGKTYLGFTREVREAAGLDLGSLLEIEIELDTQPREVDVPPELAFALAHDGHAKATYDALSFTHRREYAQWVGGAKRPDTRERRASQAVEMLLAGTRHP